MLPSGHIAAGYLLAEGTLRLLQPDLAPHQLHYLLWAGAFFAFVPDLDMFYAFFKARGFTLPDKEVNHRYYVTHRPLVWLIPSIAVYAFGAWFELKSVFFQFFGLMILLGAWSHFALDSFKVGVMWLWPFTNRYFAFRSPGEREQGPKLGFFGFWLWFLKYYPKQNPVTFYLEVLILLTAAFVLWQLYL